MRHKELITRYHSNPIITANDIPYKVNSVFNPGAIRVNGDTVLLMRVEDRKGMSHFTMARSPDGLSNWQIDRQPAMQADPVNCPEEGWGIEDPRITYLESIQKWAVVYTAYSKFGPLVSLATTSDLKHFKRLGPVLPPENKDAALFPNQFAGEWAMIHRPVPMTKKSKGHIWISFSPDLIHWGKHQILLSAKDGCFWDVSKIGLSAPPLRTDQGWLILYHGVKSTASGSIYRMGLALAETKNPGKIIARNHDWIFGPRESYERRGDVNNVVFSCGWTRDDDRIYIYYGAADTCIGVATASVTELLDKVMKDCTYDQK